MVFLLVIDYWILAAVKYCWKPYGMEWRDRDYILVICHVMSHWRRPLGPWLSRQYAQLLSRAIPTITKTATVVWQAIGSALECVLFTMLLLLNIGSGLSWFLIFNFIIAMTSDSYSFLLWPSLTTVHNFMTVTLTLKSPDSFNWNHWVPLT